MLERFLKILPFYRGSSLGADGAFLKRYQTLLYRQYHSFDLGGLAESRAVAEAKEIVGNTDDASWEDLYHLESLLIELEPKEALLRHAWLIRSEYAELSSTEEIKEYDDSSPPNSIDSDSAVLLLRADLKRIQSEIHWRYITLWAFEDFRAKVLKRVFWLTAGTFTIIALLLAFAADACARKYHLNLNVALPVLAAGWLGGLISTLRRIHSIKLSGNADEALTKLDGNKMSIAVSPLLGSVFAGVLFFLFASTAIQGALFPNDISTWLTTYEDYLVFEAGYFDWDLPVAIYQPQKHIRMQSQMGWFTIWGEHNGPLEKQCQKCVKQLRIPQAAIPAAKEFLAAAGIDYSTIYPGLDGFARMLRGRYGI